MSTDDNFPFQKVGSSGNGAFSSEVALPGVLSFLEEKDAAHLLQSCSSQGLCSPSFSYRSEIAARSAFVPT